MTKKTYKLNMSLIPLLLIVALGIGAYYFLGGEFNRSKIRRISGFPTVTYTERNVEKRRDVIKSEEELAEFLNYVDDSDFLTVREKINFDKEWLLGVSTSTNSETGHDIRVRKVYEDKANSKLLISIREQLAGTTCLDVEVKPNVAVDLVAINHTDMSIEFERIKEIKECE